MTAKNNVTLEKFTVAQITTAVSTIAGAIKKKLGHDVTSEKVEGRGRVYNIRTEG